MAELQQCGRITKEELAEYRLLARECGITIPSTPRNRQRNRLTNKRRQQLRHNFFKQFSC